MSKQKAKYKKRTATTTAHPTVPTPQLSRSKKKNGAGSRFLREHWRQLSVLALLAIGLYIQTLSFSNVLDDTILITKNKFTQKGIAGIPEILGNETFKGHFGEQKELVEGGRYRPLSMVSFALEKSVTGGNVAISHLINVLLYALTGI